MMLNAQIRAAAVAMRKTGLNLFHIPNNSGQPHKHVKYGPTVLYNYVKPYLETTFQIDEYFLPTDTCPIDERTIYDRIIKAGQNDLNVYLGGDHAVSAATVIAFKEMNPGKELGLVVVDSHTDIHTKETTETGNLHGTWVSYATGMEPLFWVDSDGIEPENVVYIGAHDIDNAEKEIMSKYNICNFDREYIKKLGMAHTMEATFNKLSHCDKIHVSFDVDSTDFVKSTGTVVPGGISYMDALIMSLYIKEFLIHTVNSIDIVEFNPYIKHDTAHKDLDMIADVILTATTDYNGMEPFEIKY